MALSSLPVLLALAGPAQAKDQPAYHAELAAAAAQCKPTPAAGQPVPFKALQTSLGGLNERVADIMEEDLTPKKAAALLADGLLDDVDGQVNADDLKAQADKLAAIMDTDAASPSGVETSRDEVEITRLSMARQLQYLDLVLNPRTSRPLSPDDLFAVTGVTEDRLEMELRRVELATTAKDFLDATRWDCSDALAYVATNGSFPAAETEVPAAAALEPIKVTVTLRDPTSFAKADTSTYSTARAGLVDEWTAAEEERAGLEEHYEGITRVEKRYDADGETPKLDIKVEVTPYVAPAVVPEHTAPAPVQAPAPDDDSKLFDAPAAQPDPTPEDFEEEEPEAPQK